jgi:succinate dehydrogenase / fumarate reductase iron-sulfur subunit
MSSTVKFRIWRGDSIAGEFREYDTPLEEGEVVLDVVHRIQAEHAVRAARR